MIKFETSIMETDKIAHHKIASVHREMTDAEFKALSISIEEVGQIEPIKLYRGKLVDGRHRQKALSELGIHDIKVEHIPNNTSMANVMNIAMGTEVRRADNAAQKAIRAYRWYQNNADTSTQEEAGIKFAVARADVGRAKKLEEIIGSKKVNKLYEDGSLIIAGTRYSTLRSIIKTMTTTPPDPENRIELSESVKNGFLIIDALLELNDRIGLAQMSTYLKKARLKEIG